VSNPPPLPEVEARLSAGVAAGIITSDQALALRRLPLDSPRERFSTVRPGDEPFSLFRGFRDVFLALGIIILATGLVRIAVDVFGLRAGNSVGWSDVGLAAVLAAIAWAVGEWVTGRLRMPLASLVTASAFSAAFMVALANGFVSAGVVAPMTVGQPVTAGLAFSLGALLFYLRFRLPFAALLVGLGLSVAAFSFLDDMAYGSAQIPFRVFAVALGVVFFLTALFYELKDPRRETRLAENAFWLHLIAAPLIVFALTGGLDEVAINSTGEAVQVFVVVALLGMIALLIDRRAFIVSALLYLAGAITYAISQSGMPSNIQFASTSLVLGLFIVGLALGWQPLRETFLKLLPQSVSSKLPNPAGPDALGG